MARINVGSLNLTVTTQSENAQRTLQILEEFLDTIPVIIDRFATRAYIAARAIAPEQKSKFTLKSTGKDKSKKLAAARIKLKDTIYVDSVTESGFTIGAGGGSVRSGVKALMQEFGYPYDNWYGPYDPNPNSPKSRFRGLGYLRVGLIVAARSLDSDRIDYNLVNVSKADVKNYERYVSTTLNRIVQSFALRFARGELNKLPKYYSRKVKAPTQTVAPNVSRFGSFKGLKVSIPLSVDIGKRSVTGMQLQGITQSKSGKSQVSPSSNFLI